VGFETLSPSSNRLTLVPQMSLIPTCEHHTTTKKIKQQILDWKLVGRQSIIEI